MLNLAIWVGITIKKSLYIVLLGKFNAFLTCLDFSGRPPSQLEVRSRPSIPNRSEAYCRLHEGYEEAARQSAGAAATPSQPQSALANRNKPGCRLHESGSSNSPEGDLFIFVFMKAPVWSITI